MSSSRPKRSEVEGSAFFSVAHNLADAGQVVFPSQRVTPYRHRMRDEKHYYVYILASRSRTLYTGITSRLETRLQQHRDGDGFASRYRCHRLVLLETYTHATTAIAREKQLKRWNRAKKIALIERSNPLWNDLSTGWGKPMQLFCEKPRTTDPSTALRSIRDDEESSLPPIIPPTEQPVPSAARRTAP